MGPDLPDVTALTGLSQAEVAGRACLSLHTIKLAEVEGEPNASEAALAAIRVALEDQGVISRAG